VLRFDEGAVQTVFAVWSRGDGGVVGGASTHVPVHVSILQR
jgi:hypothetical protein